MVRSKWIKALVVALASTGLSSGLPCLQAGPPAPTGQTVGSPYTVGPGKTAQVAPAGTTPRLAPTPTAAAGETIITVQEAGKPAQRCKVLKTWKMDDGSIASQVKALDSGETMTIVEDGKGPVDEGHGVRDIASRIFHWARGTPPPGTPVMPDETAIVINQTPTPVRPPVVVSNPVPPPVVVSNPGPQRVWPPAHTTRPATRQELANTPAFKGQIDPGHHRIEIPMTPPPTVVTTPKPAPPVSAPVKVETKVAQPGDWRDSWGKPDTTKPVAPKVTVKADPPKPPPPKIELPVATKTKNDPLKSPTAYNRKTMDDRSLQKPPMPVKPPTPVKADMPATLPPPPPPPPPSTAEVASSVPLGAQSVVQSGSTNFVPVPVVTLPDVRRPAFVPAGRPPQPPQPNTRVMQKSYTAAPAPVEMPADMVNAFTPPQAQPQSAPEAVAQSGAFGAGQPVPSAALPYPPAYHQAMMARAMQAGYPQAPGYGTYPPGYPATMADRPPPAEEMTPAGPTSVPQLLGVLKESMYPSQREWAAARLGDFNGHTQPNAVAGLTRAAREDPAAIVRAACVRSLARMGVTTTPVTTALQACKADADPRVQQEAEQALTGLGVAPAASIQQTGEKPN